MNLRKVLNQIMYKDVCDVYRAEMVTEGATDDYTEKNSLIYEGMHCKLAVYHERPTFHNDDVSHKATLNYMLYCSPEYEILENDLVEIRGMKLYAGKAFIYATHAEIQMKRRKEGGQL